MRIRDRYVSRILAAPLHVRHWRALIGILSTFGNPVAALARYLANSGSYPWSTTLRTPLGRVHVILEDRHDLLTLNEIFCRRDYGSRAHRTVVDIGANVGFATLFFLTRSPEARVWAFEPDPANVERLRRTLAGYEARYVLSETAVTAGDATSVRFVTQGRYGHVAGPDENGVDVPAVSIAEALRRVAGEAGPIDLVKIDTEGTDPLLAAALPSDVRVGEVRYEDGEGHVVTVHPPSAPRSAATASGTSR